MNDCSSKIQTIPASDVFADTLVHWIMAQYDDKFEKLPHYLILLPTRRACRTVQEAFLRKTAGQPILLPRLHPIGDVDGEELLLSSGAQTINDIPPALAPIKQQILLSKLIHTQNPELPLEQSMNLAKSLGQLMDQIHTEDLDLSLLPELVEEVDLGEHWQITTEFLKILSEHWPNILQEQGVIDGADRRNRLIHALAGHWKNNPPNHPIIAAGITGSIPATTSLLKKITTLKQGHIILPGLDKNLPDFAWDLIDEGHPQYTLKKLIEDLKISRADITTLSTQKTHKVFEKFISHAMAPPDYTNEWQRISLSNDDKTALEDNLKNITRYNCENIEQEAQTISLIIREALEEQGKTVALVTPNRYLARRAAIACKRWNIHVDDSGGIPLKETRPGIFLKLVMQVFLDQFKPLELLSLLKHELSQGGGFNQYRSTVRLFDKDLCRGIGQSGLQAYEKFYNTLIDDEKVKNKPHNDTLKFVQHLEQLFAPLEQFDAHHRYKFDDILKAHIETAENLAAGEANDGASLLWRGEAGNSISSFLSELREHARLIDDCTPHDYHMILEQFMTGQSVRPKYGTHPRVMILGQMEARLMQADCVILSGLNEGIWPADAGHDPWMSRPMREKFGLPKPERVITLAAHDFVENICAHKVYLTRAKKEDGVPTVPARWLQRIDTLLQAINISPNILDNGPHLNYLEQLNKIDTVCPIERPQPKPNTDMRPTKMSVTKIEKWRQDPYAIYAQYILGLYKLDPIDQDTNVAKRGTILHKIMEKFITKHPKSITDNAQHDFIELAKDIIVDNHLSEKETEFWLPRLKKLGAWVVSHENTWRLNARFLKSEIEGEITLNDNIDSPFTLTAIADRIDLKHTGDMAIIDYKSGGTYSTKKIQSGDLPQLALEGLMLEQDGFKKDGIQNKKIGEIAYWKLTGGKTAGEVTTLDNKEELEALIEQTKEGLLALIKIFESPDTAYIAIPNLDNPPPYNDYEHLERVKEWAALGEDASEASA